MFKCFPRSPTAEPPQPGGHSKATRVADARKNVGRGPVTHLLFVLPGITGHPKTAFFACLDGHAGPTVSTPHPACARARSTGTCVGRWLQTECYLSARACVGREACALAR